MVDKLFKPKTQTRRGRLASQGKSAEAKVQAVLQQLGLKARFDWERNYDARSAGGIAFARRTGDFTWYADGAHGAIEVKEVEHDYRLSFKNLETHQVAKLLRRQMAGGKVVVLVRHMPLDVWRELLLDGPLERPTPSGSWNLTHLPTYSSLEEVPYMAEILNAYGN